jgi:hypothetical protein
MSVTTTQAVAVRNTTTGAVAVFASRDMDPDVREAWMEWSRRHQIDPNEFTIPNFIEVDRVNRTGSGYQSGTPQPVRSPQVRSRYASRCCDVNLVPGSSLAQSRAAPTVQTPQRISRHCSGRRIGHRAPGEDRMPAI